MKRALNSQPDATPCGSTDNRKRNKTANLLHPFKNGAGKLLLLCLMMTSLGAWGQTLDGYYKFRNRANNNNYYLSVSNNNYQNNPLTPYLCSSNTNTGDEAIWAVYSDNGPKILVHAIDGRVVVCHDPRAGGQKVHLEANVALTNTDILFTQTPPSNNNNYYWFKPNAAPDNTYLKPHGGNPNDIGLYTSTTDYGNQWTRADADAPTIQTPVITRNANGTATITCANTYAKIFYTTDGSTPTSSSTAYTAGMSIPIGQTDVIEAIAYVGPNWAGEERPKSTVAESLPADVTSSSAGYVITYQNNKFFGDNSTTPLDIFNPSTSIWTNNNNKWRNSSGYYLNSENSGTAANNRSGTVTLTDNQNLSQDWSLTGNEDGTTGSRLVRNRRSIYYYSGDPQNWLSTPRDNTRDESKVVFSATKYTYPERSTNPTISGSVETFSTTEETATYAGSGASYTPSYFDYVFYNGAHHYCLTETSDATTQRPESEDITYSWSLSCPAANATVDNNGMVSYVSYFNDDTDVTLTLTATTASGHTLEATKIIRFEAPREDPTGVSTENVTVYVGNTANVPVTLTPTPCYKRLNFVSGNTAIATVNATTGVVTGVAVGTTTVTVTAYKIDGNTLAPATATITVKDKVATPEITFIPNNDGLTASTTISTTTTGATIYYTTDGTTPTASSTKYTAAFNVNNQQTVRAIAIMTGDYAAYYDNSEVAELMYSAKKVPTPVINVRGYEVTFSCDEPGVTYYYTTNGSEPTTSSTPWNGSTAITGSNNMTIKVIATKTGFAQSDVADRTLSTAHVVYLQLGRTRNGDGSQNDPVNSWANAYAKLGYGPNAAYLREQWRTHGADANTRNMASNAVFNNATFTSTVDNNIIYLVGDVSESQFSTLMGVTQSDPTSEYNLMYRVITSGFFKPVTISGKYANSGYNTEGYARITINGGTKYTLNEDMRFEYVEFYSGSQSSSTDFMLAYYDLEMGEGIMMKNFLSTKDFNTYHHGYAQGVTNAAHILFYGGLTCDKRFGTSPAGAYNFDYYLPHPSGYKITIRSGYFSTISPGGTQWDNTTSLNGTMGSPNTPVKCTITIDIDHKWNDDHKSGVLNKASNGNPDCDVAVVIAGTHEGAMYGDVDIIIKSGRIDRVVNGTFGANNFVSNHPADSYFGRANILIDPREPSTAESSSYSSKNDMVVIRELYGGGLGRFKSTSSKDSISSTYFYGKSSVVINGGTFKSAIYASGAGGVNGVGDANHHTNDGRLPYLDGTTLKYGSWASYNTKNKLGITCHVGRPDINKPDFHTNDNEIEETIYLADTKANIEIHGGVFGSSTNPIEGIFGGGYGFVDAELINYTGTNGAKPNTRAGAIFAAAGKTASSVTIDGDAEIYGNIYGAGRGDNRYKNASITYNSDDYTQLGQVSGNVELTIAGNAKIHGSIYGAGQGIEGYTNMARLYGNTTVTIGENAVIDSSVYGGGQNGTVDKNNSQYGNTEVKINGGQVKQDVYGGGALANVSGNTEVKLTAGKVDGDVYGGGLGRTTGTPIAALVNGDATTTLNGSIIGGSIFGANNVNGTPKGHVFVDIKKTTPRANQGTNGYDLPAVYGGGNKADYDPTSNTDFAQVLVETCNNSVEYVYGGGNAAAVPETQVTIEGGRFNYVFAGGNGAGQGNPGADVGYKNHSNTTYGAGTAQAIIHGGDINHLFAGSNTLGRIRESQSVSVDNDNCDLHINEVYGGGNEAAGKAGTLTIGCTGEGRIDNVYGGANAADVTGDIILNIEGGNIGNVFGGNNTRGSIIGTITVNVDWTGSCNSNSLDNVYGGGNQASYTAPDSDGNNWPKVNIRNAVIEESVFGGGLGSDARVIGNPQVTISTDCNADGHTNAHSVHIGGSVYGGGSAAPVTGNPVVNTWGLAGDTKKVQIDNHVFGGGLGQSAVVTGNTEVNIKGNTVVNKNVYGGGNGGEVTGDTHVVIGE